MAYAWALNQPDYVEFTDVESTAKKAYQKLADHTDFVIGITHLDIKDDLELAKQMPEVPLFMGGHDHTNMLHKVDNSVVAKADANARTVYVHRLTYHTKDKRVELESELIKIDDTIEEEAKTKKVVDEWVTIMSAGIFKKMVLI